MATHAIKRGGLFMSSSNARHLWTRPDVFGNLLIFPSVDDAEAWMERQEHLEFDEECTVVEVLFV